MNASSETSALATRILLACRAQGRKVATAESCTGGMVAAAITDIPGSSDALDRAFVTYSNDAKSEMLGVPPGLIAAVGAVSEDVAKRMAEGALARSAADIAVAITGIAGPGGGSAQKPVGTVWFGLVQRDIDARTEHRLFPGDRAAIRAAATRYALELLIEALD
jgi:nicotinamide-nucleotide amidase